MTGKYLIVAVLALCGNVVFGQDGCNAPAVLSGSSGTVTSPNPYANNARCRWTVNGTPGKILELNFNRIDLEYSGSCTYDKVVIYDEAAVDSVLAYSPCASQSNSLSDKHGPFCGSDLPDTIFTTGNRIVVELCSDNTATAAGFEFAYKEATAPTLPATGDDCNQTVVVDGKHETVHYSPAGYKSFQKCSYSYKSKNGKALKINSQSFAMEGIIGCRYDSLSAFDGSNNAAPSLGRFCGTNGPKDVRSSGSNLYLEFSSDQYTNGKGFALTIEESCSGDHLCRKTDENTADVCYSHQSICDAKRDCPNGQDESFCADDCGAFPTWAAGQPFPGAAAITHIDGQIHCGGALINERFVITTAHCFHRLDNKPERFVVKLGAAKLADALVVQIKKITVHPSFNPKTLASNLALVELETPAPVQSTIAPFCVPFTTETSSLAEGAQCYTLGWGRSNANSINSYVSTVKQFTATVLSNNRCRWTNSPVVVDNNSICASTSGNLCYGDNGAPLVCKHRNGKWQLYGVNSVAFGCTQSSMPAAFVKVSAFQSWIAQVAFPT